MKLLRGGKTLGNGAYGQVTLAVVAGRSVAVKTSIPSSPTSSASLQLEANVLSHLRGCPYVVDCLGYHVTLHNGVALYNLFLEYASGGSLADYIKSSGGRLPEQEVRHLACSLLRGLAFIHAKGYVHCDIKPQNILVYPSAAAGVVDVKIADFGLAKKVGVKVDNGKNVRGTAPYLSPESITDSSYEPPMDVWGLGCVVAEMFSGKSVWDFPRATEIWSMLYQIGFKNVRPKIPEELSDAGRDFLDRCFERDPKRRWTVEMLLDHPFVSSSLESKL